ncbi:MAG: hypothetical protein ABW189_05645 [Rickettsiales bacterium]
MVGKYYNALLWLRTKPIEFAVDMRNRATGRQCARLRCRCWLRLIGMRGH